MALTKVQVISNALTMIGKGPIIALGVDQTSSAAEQAFDFLFTSDISKNQWRFASKIVQLSALDETLPTILNWRYIYQLPGDYLSLIRLYPNIRRFEIYEDNTLYCNSNVLWLEYVFQPNITKVPNYFWEYFACKLGAYLALSSAVNPQISTYLDGQAAMKKFEAMAIDAKNRPQSPIADAPIIANRFIGYDFI
jgi:hypothetical protein